MKKSITPLKDVTVYISHANEIAESIFIEIKTKKHFTLFFDTSAEIANFVLSKISHNEKDKIEDFGKIFDAKAI